MTIRHDHYLNIDFVMAEGETELVVSIRTLDGSKIDHQDALDGFMAALEELYGLAPVPLTKSQTENDPDLH